MFLNAHVARRIRFEAPAQHRAQRAIGLGVRETGPGACTPYVQRPLDEFSDKK